MSQKSDGEDAFAAFWERFSPPSLRDRLERQFKFDPTRNWQADFRVGWVIVEIEGGIWKKGRHNQAPGFMEDCRKYNRATSLGFRVLRYATEMVTDDPEGVVLQVVNTYLRSNRDERRP